MSAPVHSITLTSRWQVVSPSMFTRTSALPSLTSHTDLYSASGAGPQPGATLAAGRCIFSIPSGSLVMVRLFGTGDDNSVGQGQFWTWEGIDGPAEGRSRFDWTNTLHAAWNHALSGNVGVAGGLVTASMRYADTITLTEERGLEPNNVRVMEPASADDQKVTLVIDPLGAELGMLLLRNGTGSGTATTGINAMIRGVSGG